MTVLDFARRLEQSGFDFYTEMAQKTSKEGAGKVFRLLAGDQQRLLEQLRRMQERFAAIDRDTEAFGRAINVFEKLRRQEQQRTVGSDLDAYLLAIGAEREVVGQYRNLLERIKSPDLKRIVMRVLSLDRRELEELEQLYDFVNAPTDSLEWGEFSNLDEFHNFGRYDDLRQGDLEDPVIPEPYKH